MLGPQVFRKVKWRIVIASITNSIVNSVMKEPKSNEPTVEDDSSNLGHCQTTLSPEIVLNTNFSTVVESRHH